MNNANCGYNFRNNTDNNFLESIYDKFTEITFIKQYHNLFDPKISDFVNLDLIEQEINRSYDEKFIQISKDDLFRNVRITALDNQKREDLYGITCLKRKERKKNENFSAT